MSYTKTATSQVYPTGSQGLFGCTFCPATFPSKSHQRDHIFTHFHSELCPPCGMRIIFIADEWYTLTKHDAECSAHVTNDADTPQDVLPNCVVFDESVEHGPGSPEPPHWDYAAESMLEEKYNRLGTEEYDEQARSTSRKSSKAGNSIQTQTNLTIKQEPQEKHAQTVKTEDPVKAEKKKRPFNRYQHARPSDLRPAGKITCDICGRVSKNYDCMRKHMLRFHMSSEGRAKGAIDYSYVTATDLRTAGPYECDMCHLKLSRFDNLRQHLKRHLTAKTSFECQICHTKLMHRASLKVHMRRHTGQLPYMCDACGKSFNHPHNLSAHMLTHSNTKPYQCGVCQKWFRSPTNLQRHHLVHTGVKANKCPIEGCDRAYMYMIDLKRHKYSAHGIWTKKYPCQGCDKVYPERKLLRKHMLTHH